VARIFYDGDSGAIVWLLLAGASVLSVCASEFGVSVARWFFKIPPTKQRNSRRQSVQSFSRGFDPQFAKTTCF
jgi:hypothetical protein